MDLSSCKIIALNAKAIQLAQQRDDRGAIKLFLQGLSQLKSELNTCNKHSCTSSEDGAFLRVPVNASANGRFESEVSSARSCNLNMFDRLLGLCQNADPCAPQIRDGVTALFLYNAGATEHHLALRDTNTQQKALHLKKASQVYNMALTAAQHWKHWTTDHKGYSILCLAIVNNLLSMQWNSKKAEQLKVLMKNTLASAGNTISEDERTFFANHLDELTKESSKVCTNENNLECATSVSTTKFAI